MAESGVLLHCCAGRICPLHARRAQSRDGQVQPHYVNRNELLQHQRTRMSRKETANFKPYKMLHLGFHSALGPKKRLL
eukprot:1162075-Pelagomonas_calceolata.AAC.5